MSQKLITAILTNGDVVTGLSQRTRLEEVGISAEDVREFSCSTSVVDQRFTNATTFRLEDVRREGQHVAQLPDSVRNVIMTRSGWFMPFRENHNVRHVSVAFKANIKPVKAVFPRATVEVVNRFPEPPTKLFKGAKSLRFDEEPRTERICLETDNLENILQMGKGDVLRIMNFTGDLDLRPFDFKKVMINNSNCENVTVGNRRNQEIVMTGSTINNLTGHAKTVESVSSTVRTNNFRSENVSLSGNTARIFGVEGCVSLTVKCHTVTDHFEHFDVSGVRHLSVEVSECDRIFPQPHIVENLNFRVSTFARRFEYLDDRELSRYFLGGVTLEQLQARNDALRPARFHPQPARFHPQPAAEAAEAAEAAAEAELRDAAAEFATNAEAQPTGVRNTLTRLRAAIARVSEVTVRRAATRDIAAARNVATAAAVFAEEPEAAQPAAAALRDAIARWRAANARVAEIMAEREARMNAEAARVAAAAAARRAAATQPTERLIHESTQSVHTAGLESSAHAEIKKLIDNAKDVMFDPLQFLQEHKISAEHLRLLKTYCQESERYSDVLRAVVFRAFTLEHVDEFVKRLSEELVEGRGKCHLGRINRLVNSLSGLAEEIDVKISPSEDISNQIILARRNQKTLEETRAILVERGHTTEMIDTWLEHW